MYVYTVTASLGIMDVCLSSYQVDNYFHKFDSLTRFKNV